MLVQALLFFFLFLLLFFISRKISSYIYLLVFLLTGSDKLAIWTLIILFLPGTIIHEVSHLVVATILRVPTGRLSIIPERDLGGEIKAGKLALGKTDPFRYTAIGIAPMLVGLTLIYLIGKFILPQVATSFFLLFIVYCLLFTVSTTMFSSKKDLGSFIFVAPITFLLLASFYFAGVRISFTGAFVEKTAGFLSEVNYFLLVTNIIDFIVLLFLALNLSLWQKILQKKVLLSS